MTGTIPPEVADDLTVAIADLGWIGYARVRIAGVLGIATMWMLPDTVLEPVIDALVDGEEGSA